MINSGPAREFRPPIIRPGAGGVRGFAPGSVELIRSPLDGETYRWSRDGTQFLADGVVETGATIAGSHTTHMTISGMSALDEGLYVLHATRGNVESMVDSVRVYFDRDLPEFISVPQDREACLGGETTFHAGVAGTNVALQWYRNGVKIEEGLASNGAFTATGAQSETLRLTGLTPAAAGFYLCRAESTASFLDNATFEVELTLGTNTVPPEVITQPQPTAVCLGETAEFTCDGSDANSGGPESAVSFQWRKDGTPIDDTARIQGSNTTRLAINGAQASDAGMYDCIVSRACASAVTQAAPLTILNPCCVADTDDGSGTGLRDGGVTIDDLLYYLYIFEQGAIAADVDDGSGSGTPDGGVTIDDLLYYLLRFEAGC